MKYEEKYELAKKVSPKVSYSHEEVMNIIELLEKNLEIYSIYLDEPIIEIDEEYLEKVCTIKYQREAYIGK